MADGIPPAPQLPQVVLPDPPMQPSAPPAQPIDPSTQPIQPAPMPKLNKYIINNMK